MSAAGQLLSRNELYALLKRACEAHFGRACDYEAIAEQILWLECHGLSGVQLAQSCIEKVHSSDLQAISPLIGTDTRNKACLNAEGASLLCIADLLADFTISRAAADGFCCIELSNVHETPAILPQLTRIRQAGFVAALWVSDESAGTVAWARITPEASLPDLTGWENAPQRPQVATLTLVAAQDEKALSHAASAAGAAGGAWPKPEVTPEMLEQCHNDCLSHGIPVDDLGLLNEIADRILVETSEASRMGAGD